jgi:hypothetical protein
MYIWHPNIRQSPANIRQSPANIRRSPANIRQSPANIRQSPANIRQSPANIRQPQPTFVSPQPTFVSPQPTFISPQPTFIVSGRCSPSLSPPPPPPAGVQGCMDSEERLAPHHPSPHHGVEGSWRTSLDQVTYPQSSPPASPSGVAGRSRQLARPQQHSDLPHPSTPSRTAPTWADIVGGGLPTPPTKRPLLHPQLMPLLFTSDTPLWDY